MRCHENENPNSSSNSFFRAQWRFHVFGNSPARPGYNANAMGGDLAVSDNGALTSIGGDVRFEVRLLSKTC
jgi:hypothetical protein